MTSVIHTKTEKLIKMFGVKAPGGRRIPAEVVTWLLTDPCEDDLLGAVLVLFLCKYPWLPYRSYVVLPDFDLGDFYDA